MAIKDEYFTISEAARELGVTRQTISRWISQDKIKGERIGKETLIKKKDLFDYQQRKLIDAAARQIVALMNRAYTDYCQAKGYIKAVEHVEEVNTNKYSDFVELLVEGLDGSTRRFKLSAKENRKVLDRANPKLVKYLEDFSATMKEKAKQLIGGNWPKKVKGGSIQE